MKTIFDKVDPKYIDCTTGLCEHASHQYNTVMLIVTIVVLSTIGLNKLLRD